MSLLIHRAPHGLRLAAKIAEGNVDYERWKMGCVIKKGGAVQAVGWNVFKQDPTYLDDHSECSTHCEERALRVMRTNPSDNRNVARGCTIFIARKLRDPGYGLAMPCEICQTLLAEAGIRKAVYTIDSHSFGVWTPERIF